MVAESITEFDQTITLINAEDIKQLSYPWNFRDFHPLDRAAGCGVELDRARTFAGPNGYVLLNIAGLSCNYIKVINVE